MSTTPGDSSWADAGLVPPDSSAVPGSERTTVPQDPETQPRSPRPDLRDEAEQPEEEGEPPGPGRPSVPEDAPEGDALDQATGVDEVGFGPDDVQRDDATEGDVLEQRHAVPEDGADDYRG